MLTQYHLFGLKTLGWCPIRTSTSKGCCAGLSALAPGAGTNQQVDLWCYSSHI